MKWKLPNDRLFPSPQLVEVDLRLTEVNAVGREPCSLVEHSGGVQQSLGGNATDDETDAAKDGVALDEDNSLPEVGGPEGGGVAARPGAQNQYFGMDIGFADRTADGGVNQLSGRTREG